MLSRDVKFHLHSELVGSFVNGPTFFGRYVFWVQHCPFACPGCFNPETWSKEGGYYKSVDALVDSILSSNCDGLTISGGEPLLQRDALLELLVKLEPHVLHGQLSQGIICYTGFRWEELQNLDKALEISKLVDVLIDGRFVDDQKTPDSIAGSANQSFLFSDRVGRGESVISRIALEEIDKAVEIHGSEREKTVQITGFPNIDRKLLKRLGLTVKRGDLK